MKSEVDRAVVEAWVSRVESGLVTSECHSVPDFGTFEIWRRGGPEAVPKPVFRGSDSLRQAMNGGEAFEIDEPVAATIASELFAGRSVKVRGLGEFVVQERRPFSGISPATGEPIRVPGRRMVAFECTERFQRSLSAKLR